MPPEAFLQARDIPFHEETRQVFCPGQHLNRRHTSSVSCLSWYQKLDKKLAFFYLAFSYNVVYQKLKENGIGKLRRNLKIIHPSKVLARFLRHSSRDFPVAETSRSSFISA